jgi:hypothetical protein
MHSAFDIGSTAGLPYPQILCLQIENIWKKTVSAQNIYGLFFLSLFPKQRHVTTSYMTYVLYLLLQVST